MTACGILCITTTTSQHLISRRFPELSPPTTCFCPRVSIYTPLREGRRCGPLHPQDPEGSLSANGKPAKSTRSLPPLRQNHVPRFPAVPCSMYSFLQPIPWRDAQALDRSTQVPATPSAYPANSWAGHLGEQLTELTRQQIPAKAFMTRGVPGKPTLCMPPNTRRLNNCPSHPGHRQSSQGESWISERI